MPPSQKAMPSSTSVDSKHNSNSVSNTGNNHSNSGHTSSSSGKKSSTAGRSQRVPNLNNSTNNNQNSVKEGAGGSHHQKGSTNNNNNNLNNNSNSNKHSNHSNHSLSSKGQAQLGHYDTKSDSDDSYTPGGGFISEMDEHDSVFEGGIEYDGEDGPSFLGDDFDASSDVAPDTREDRKEKRARDFQERLLKLELEFEENKQTIYDYQMARYKEEMAAILNGQKRKTSVHPDFHDQMEDLAEARDITIVNARLYRDYQFECAQQAYELETELAEEDYMAEREGLREKMLAVIDSKRRALRDDKENLDITNDFALEPTSRANHTRRLRKRGHEQEVGSKNAKRKTNAPPNAKWAATDTDILDDLSQIRKVVSSSTTKKSASVKKK